MHGSFNRLRDSLANSPCSCEAARRTGMEEVALAGAHGEEPALIEGWQRWVL